MTGFNENSQMPEKASGSDESAVVTQHGPTDNPEPSTGSTDRYGLAAQGKSYLIRKYDIAISAAGNPYFKPMESLIKQFTAEAEGILTEARARVLGDEELRDRVEARAKTCLPYFDSMLEDVGDDREWLARSMVIWPMTDQVGYQLYKACSGEADLLDYAGYLARTDATIQSAQDLESHENYQKRAKWTDLAYDELGVVDGVIAEVDPDSLKYNLEAIIRAGYQSAANLDTRNHLRGVQGNTPVADDQPLDDFKAQVLASRRIASQAA